MEVLGQVYRDAGGAFTLLAIRVLPLRNDLGRGFFFPSAFLMGCDRFGIGGQSLAQDP